MTNKNIRNINRTLAKITRKLPVNVTITSKLQTAISIVACYAYGIACYAYGIGMMLKADKPSYYIPMPTITPVMPTITPVMPEPTKSADSHKIARALELVEKISESPYAFVGGYGDDPHSITISCAESGDNAIQAVHLHENNEIAYRSADMTKWERFNDAATYEKIRNHLREFANNFGYYTCRMDADK